MGESMVPSDADHCKMLAYLFSVSGIVARHVGLVNKTAQSDWEISFPVLQYLDSVKRYFFENFSGFVSSNFAQSCDRQFKGFISRSVAGCLFSTVVQCMEQGDDPKESGFRILQCMESSALTVYWANLALLNGFTHLCDSGLCVVNQLVKWRLDLPTLRLDFLCAALDPDAPLDESCADFEALRRFLERLRNAKTREEEGTQDSIKHFTGSYVQVHTL